MKTLIFTLITSISLLAATPVCDRSPSIRDAILKELGVEDCHSVTEEDLLEVRQIYVYHSRYLRLDAGDFDGLTNLENLHLREPNAYKFIHKDVFKGLKNLKFLYMKWLNGVKTGINFETLFSPLESLEELVLENAYNFRHLPDGMFVNNKKLRRVRLDVWDLKVLNEKLLYGAESLEHFEIFAPNVTQVPAGFLADTQSLCSLDLSGLGLKAIPAGLFNGLEELRYLNLSDNKLEVIRPGTFDGLVSLEDLNLHANKIGELSAGTFANNSNLKYLELSNNPLTNVEVGAFDGLGELEGLYFSNTELETLEVGVFDGLGNLRELGIENARLTKLDAKVFEPVAGLERLTIFNNELGEDTKDELGRIFGSRVDY